jgi:flagellar biosynthesis protein FliQ
MEQDLRLLVVESFKTFIIVGLPYLVLLSATSLVVSFLQGLILLRDPAVNFAARFLVFIGITVACGIQLLPFLLEFTRSSLGP